MLGEKKPVMITSGTKQSKITVTSKTVFKPKVSKKPQTNTPLATPTPTIPPGNRFVFQ